MNLCGDPRTVTLFLALLLNDAAKRFVSSSGEFNTCRNRLPVPPGRDFVGVGETKSAVATFAACTKCNSLFLWNAWRELHRCTLLFHAVIAKCPPPPMK